MSTTNDLAPPVRITYSNAQEEENTLDFDLLVMACDPSALFGNVFQRTTPLERKIHTALKRFTFHTSLWDVDRSPNDKHVVRFAPDILDEMGGDGEWCICSKEGDSGPVIMYLADSTGLLRGVWLSSE